MNFPRCSWNLKAELEQRPLQLEVRRGEALWRLVGGWVGLPGCSLVGVGWFG